MLGNPNIIPFQDTSNLFGDTPIDPHKAIRRIERLITQEGDSRIANGAKQALAILHDEIKAQEIR